MNCRGALQAFSGAADVIAEVAVVDVRIDLEIRVDQVTDAAFQRDAGVVFLATESGHAGFRFNAARTARARDRPPQE